MLLFKHAFYASDL
uniref:Uncharacterized protein n=1 Tax=Arundo donax TaxID=35708 RepID=A0A0A9C5Q1_ARUDO